MTEWTFDATSHLPPTRAPNSAVHHGERPRASGLALAWKGEWWHAGWWQVKVSLVVGLTLVHHLYSRSRKESEAEKQYATDPRLTLLARRADDAHYRHRAIVFLAVL